MPEDPRRRIPRTDALLGAPRIAAAGAAVGETVLKGLIRAAQDRARAGEIAPEAVEDAVLEALSGSRASSLTPVLNATGVLVHTNLGRAPLSEAARQALLDAAGYADLELDLDTGIRSRRGAGARAALLAACPAAEDALVVNNGAAALMLATTALAQAVDGRGPGEIAVSRGEMVEIGAGFRLFELMESTGVRLREVGATNRTHLSDYAKAVGAAAPSARISAILKVHRSNFAIEGFTAEPGLAELAGLAHAHGLPLVVDLGSGLLQPEPALPAEPDAATALAAGADVVIASGDKLLGGPQAGILLGRSETIARLARHPMARAVRADKLTLAALEATLTTGTAPVLRILRADPSGLRRRTEAVAEEVLRRAPGAAGRVRVVEHEGRVGGGGGVGVPLPGWAVSLPESVARPLRLGDPAILPRVHDGACLVDVRCVPQERDGEVAQALARALVNGSDAAVDGPGGAGGRP